MKRLSTRMAHESEFERARIGGVLVAGNRVLATGKNSVRGMRHSFPRKWINSVHAEQSAILTAINKSGADSVKGSTLFVSRVNKHGELRNACPCKHCRAMIIAVGIKTVWYTNEHGDWVKWKVPKLSGKNSVLSVLNTDETDTETT